MKKQILTLSFVLCTAFGYSQFSFPTSNSASWPTSGKVGIGTTSPNYKLHVLTNDGGFLAGNYTETIASIGRNINTSLHFETKGYIPTRTGTPYHTYKLQMVEETLKVGYIEFNSQPTLKTTIAAMSFGTNGTEAMRINQDGKVRIGSNDRATPAGYKLFVEEGILTEKVKVAIANSGNWADYVFAPDYKLMPLEEVEKFTKENSHLPNVPSASEMVKNGLDVAQMDAKLLEKVEELTLYLIEQNKQIELLKTEITSLKGQRK